MLNTTRAGRVSVITPMYNVEPFVTETVESVLRQSYSDLELILVDDGSTDATPSVVAPFLADTRVRYIRQPNRGVAAARNAGFARSCGEFLAFLDADDVWMPGNLELKVDHLRRNPTVGVVQAGVIVIDSASKPVGEIRYGLCGTILRELLLWDQHVVSPPSDVLLRREVFELAGGFDIDLSTAADQDLYIRVAARWPFGCVREALTCYRIHSTAMHLDIGRMERDHLAVYAKARAKGMLADGAFRRRCYSNLYRILAGSWWVEGRRPLKALGFALMSVAIHPPSVYRLLRKAPRVAATLAR